MTIMTICHTTYRKVYGVFNVYNDTMFLLGRQEGGYTGSDYSISNCACT